VGALETTSTTERDREVAREMMARAERERERERKERKRSRGITMEDIFFIFAMESKYALAAVQVTRLVLMYICRVCGLNLPSTSV
jgi:hypothetical protein